VHSSTRGLLIYRFVNTIGSIAIIASALFADITQFAHFSFPFLHLILCTSIIALVNHNKKLLLILLVAYPIESLVFFNNIFYLPLLALVIACCVNLLRLWTHIKSCIIFTSLIVGLSIHDLFSIFYLKQCHGSLSNTIGHFIINGLLLGIYVFFENNGKQGNRSL
jgi:predicted membrane protein